MENLNQSVNEKTAAKFLNVKRQTLSNWRFLCKGPAYCKVGRRVVYLVPDLEKYLSANRVEPQM